MASDILIVDDEADIRDLVAGILEDEGFTTRPRATAISALAEISNRRPHMVFLDIWLQGSKLDGLQLLEQIKRDHAEVPVVMISGHGNIETAVAAIKRGAYDFIEKPFKADRLILVATRALENSRLKREVKELKQLAPTASIMTGRSACMNQLRQTIDRAAKANSRILIVGPAGAGKELAARTLHNASSRTEGPFVVINAAAITPERMEVELFGIEQANGEHPRKPGALEEAMAARCSSTRSPTCRVRPRTRSCVCWLIRRSSARVGRQRSMSTSESFPRLRAISRRRSPPGDSARDLYHRLSVVPIRVPPLSERREDIPELIDYFMDQISARPACRSGRSVRMRWRCCSRTSGRETCGSFATMSSV